MCRRLCAGVFQTVTLILILTTTTIYLRFDIYFLHRRRHILFNTDDDVQTQPSMNYGFSWYILNGYCSVCVLKCLGLIALKIPTTVITERHLINWHFDWSFSFYKG